MKSSIPGQSSILRVTGSDIVLRIVRRLQKNQIKRKVVSVGFEGKNCFEPFQRDVSPG